MASSSAVSKFTPKDDAVRQRITHSLDETLFVEAGAGTGKTTSLVSRVVNLIAQGKTTPDKIAAITFTEAAAAELRERVRAELQKAASDGEMPPDRRERCVQAIPDLDRASIQTLHSFAGMLLRERPLEAGLPPGFETLDAIESDLRFQDAWTGWLDTALDDPALESAFALGLTLGLNIKSMHALALEFHRNYDLLPDAPDAFGADLTGTPSSDLLKALMDEAGELLRLCAFSKIGSGDALYDHTHDKVERILRLADVDPDSPAVYRQLLDLVPLRQRKGRQGDWRTDNESGVNACKRLKERLIELNSEVEADIAACRQYALQMLCNALSRFTREYAADRKRQGYADFQDLLVWARDMLRDNLTARAHFQRRFTHLLIDESQDTDPLQAEIAMFIAEDVPSAHRNGTGLPAPQMDWEKITPRRGKMFVVGDAKQSIYRFRRADVTQLNRLQERLTAAGASLPLTQNFRSQRPVVDWVNVLFAQWMTGKTQAPYTPIEHRWDAQSDDGVKPSVWRFGDTMDGSTESVRRSEAKQMAALLRQIVGERWQVLDSDKTEQGNAGAEVYRDAKYGDICILMRARTALWALEQQLDDANVAYRIEGGALFFETQEVRDLMNCLRAIDDPANEVAIVAALRSPAFACTDVELHAFRSSPAGRGGFNYLSLPEPNGTGGGVAESLAVLRCAHDKRLWQSTASLIDGFVRDRRLMEVGVGSRRPREQWRRYRFLVEQARAFAAAGGNSLRAFLDWAQRQMDENARVSETPVPDSDEDAVRIMTIHGAKGLEFPIVILTGLNSRRSSRTPNAIFDRTSGDVEVGIGSSKSKFMTAKYDEASKREKLMEQDEHIRLMYVAATRARDHLVLSLHRLGSSTDAGIIAEKMQAFPDLWEEAVVLPQYAAAPQSHTAAQPLVVAEHSVDAHQRWLDEHKASVDEASRQASIAATRLGRSPDDKHEADPDAPEAEPARRGRAGTSIGRAVHAVLQTCDLATGADIAAAARSQAAAEGLPGREREIADLARIAIHSAMVKRAVRSGRYWREVPMAIPIGGGVLEGIIDLLFEEDGELVLVDYKTDRVSEAQLGDVAVERYGMQVGAYALAVERGTGKPVKDAALLYLSRDTEVSLGADLTRLKAYAESEAAAQFAAVSDA